MFDWVRCEADLPDGWKPKKGLFQTKDLGREMASHTITADGRLLLDQIVGIDDGRPVTEAREEPGFHGTLRFYATEEIVRVKDERMPGGERPVVRVREYAARFEGGKLTGITGGPLEI